MDVATLALPLFGLIALGFAAGRFVRLPEHGLAGLSLFVIYFALPALFFQLISGTPIENLGNWRFIAATTAATFATLVLGFAVGLISSRGKVGEATIQALAAGYANNGYMAPGLTLSAFGPAAAVPTALVFCFDNLMIFILAPIGLAVGAGERTRPGEIAMRVARRVLTHPFILATIAGVVAAAFHFRPPEPVAELLTLLSGAAAPCALFALGVVLAKQPLRRVPVELPILIALKLVAHPALVYLFLSLAGDFDPTWVFTAVLIASLPAATNVFVMAQQYGVWVRRASSAVLLSTLLAVVTVTALLYAIGAGWLPPDLFPAP